LQLGDQGRGAVGMRIEVPKVPIEVHFSERVTPPRGPPRKIIQFWILKWRLLVHSGLYFYSSAACFSVYVQKAVLLGLEKLL